MTAHFESVCDPRLQARVTGSRPMVYMDGASSEEDRPAHVRAASGLSAFMEYIAVIQDDANWLALIDADENVTAIPLPPSPRGDRVFSSNRGNKDDKYDLEACISVGSDSGPELVGFSSGSRQERAWVLRVRENGGASGGAADADIASRLTAEFVDAAAFYQSMRDTASFSGAGLNIEGALTLDDDLIRLFQRGNSKPCGGLQPVDATGDISWSALRAHLTNPHSPPPPLQNVRTYGLGQLDGVRLTFSDAEHLGGGRVLFSASAENPETGDIVGSVLGLINAGGEARWTELIDQDGDTFRGKIEGLTMDWRDPRKIHFVVDDDDEDAPSKIFEAVLSEAFFEGGVSSNG
jgi:Family of unknown function (DUF6929)